QFPPLLWSGRRRPRRSRSPARCCCPTCSGPYRAPVSARPSWKPPRIEATLRRVHFPPRGAEGGRTVTTNRRLPPQVACHLLEVVDVALHVRLGVLDRDRPVLLRPGRHQHPAIGLVEPGQVGV